MAFADKPFAFDPVPVFFFTHRLSHGEDRDPPLSYASIIVTQVYTTGDGIEGMKKMGVNVKNSCVRVC
jgi:hypothetical protein